MKILTQYLSLFFNLNLLLFIPRERYQYDIKFQKVQMTNLNDNKFS